MKYEIIFAREAADDLKKLSARDRSTIKAQVEKHLSFEPKKVSKSRIKKLKDIVQPEYRLRVDDFRIFYDVADSQVHVLAIVPKSGAATWLDEMEKQK